jgi:hypothetical protein
MVPWRFQDYWPQEGHNPIRMWEAAQEVEVRAQFDAVRDALAQTPDWLDPSVEHLFRVLDRAEEGLGEIVFAIHFKKPGARKFTDRNFRVFCKIRIQEHDCVLFIGSEKRRGTYDPPRAPQLALDYLRRFEGGRGFTDGHI